MSFRGNQCHKLVLGTAGASQLLQDRSGHEEGIAFRVYAIVRDATAIQVTETELNRRPSATIYKGSENLRTGLCWLEPALSNKARSQVAQT